MRGEIVQIAQRIARDLEEGRGSHPFDKVVWCNIGNPQILGQKPITYFRQVLALCELPQVRDVRRTMLSAAEPPYGAMCCSQSQPHQQRSQTCRQLRSAHCAQPAAGLST